MKRFINRVSNPIMYLSIMLIVYILARIFPHFMTSTKGFDYSEYDMYRNYISIAVISIGIILEYRRLIYSYKHGFKVNYVYLILSLLMFTLLFIPYETGMMITGLGIKFYILQYGLFRSIIAIVAGITFVRSLTDEVFFI